MRLIILMATLPGLTAANAAPGGGAPARPARKVIYYGWGTPETMYVREHWQEMEQMPLDGTGIDVVMDRAAWKRGTQDTGNRLGWHLFGPKAFRLEDFRPAIEDLRAARWQRFTDNFLPACIVSRDQDHNFNWFDDARWRTIRNNWRVLVTIAREGGCKGIILDPEHYGTYFFHYSSMRERADHPFAEYAAKLRQRGRDLMAVTKDLFPEAKILMFWGHSYLALYPNPARRLPPETNDYGLLPSFVDGMLEAADARTRFVDLCEFAYGYKERPQFLEAYHGIVNRAAALSSVPDLYRSKMQVGFGLWLDNGGVKHWDAADFSKNYFSPEQFRESLRTALDVSDEYVWIYSHAPRFFPRGNLPDPYLEAIRAAREPTR